MAAAKKKKAAKKAAKKKQPAKAKAEGEAKKPPRKKAGKREPRPSARKLSVPELVTLAHRAAHSRDKELLEQLGVAVDLAKLSPAKLATARGCIERLTGDKTDARVRAAQDLADVFQGRAARRKRRAG